MKHTISILCDDTPGVMTRISGLFSRRGFNIESLTVGNCELKGKSRFNHRGAGNDQVWSRCASSSKRSSTSSRSGTQEGGPVEREHALLKLKVLPGARNEVLQIVTALQARIIDSHRICGCWR
jgi:acetolactate synthase-1/3 small subunit